MDKIEDAQYHGITVKVSVETLGPYKLTSANLSCTMEKLYKLLRSVGCTYEGAPSNYGQVDSDMLDRGLATIAADNPVSIALAPVMEGDRWEYHPARELVGWPELGRHGTIGNTDELFLVNVKGISGITVYVTGAKGKRLTRIEAAIRQTFTSQT